MRVLGVMKQASRGSKVFARGGTEGYDDLSVGSVQEPVVRSSFYRGGTIGSSGLWAYGNAYTATHGFFLKYSRNGAIRSMGTGKMVVEFFSDAISVSVWRKRSCSAIGCSSMTCAASASFCEA